MSSVAERITGTPNYIHVMFGTHTSTHKCNTRHICVCTYASPSLTQLLLNCRLCLFDTVELWLVAFGILLHTYTHVGTLAATSHWLSPNFKDHGVGGWCYLSSATCCETFPYLWCINLHFQEKSPIQKDFDAVGFPPTFHL